MEPATKRRFRRRSSLIAVAIALVLVIGAEVGYLEHEHSTRSQASGPTTTVSTSVPSTPGSTSSTKTSASGSVPDSPLPKYSNNLALRPDVSTTSCQASTGGWTASGVIDNVQGNAHDFLLTVYFTDARATVLGAGQTSVTVQAKSTRTWSIHAAIDAPPGVVCVLVGVQ